LPPRRSSADRDDDLCGRLHSADPAGCAVFVSTQHSPVHLAKSVSTLDQLSHGRIESFGTGGKNRPFAASAWTRRDTWRGLPRGSR